MLGWALTFRSGVGVLLTGLTIPILIARINSEERLLREHFGAEYDIYCTHTWRLFPGSTKQPKSRNSTCLPRLQTLCQNAVVLNRPLGVASGVLDLRIAKCCIAHTQYAELGRHAIEIQADAIEIRIGRPVCQG